MFIRSLKRNCYNLRFTLGTAFVGIVILLSILFGLTTYLSVRSFIRQEIRQRLMDTVGVAALQIDAETHKNLAQSKDEKTDAYMKIKKRLQQIRNNCKDVRFVYTLRKNKKGEVIFIVDAEKNPQDMSHIGDVYETPTPQMLAVFTKPYKVEVEDQFYTDQWGTTLSSYAPVFFKNGELESALAIDMSASKIIDYERRYLFTILVFCIIASSFAVALSIFFARRISKPLMLLEADMSRIQKFDLDSKIKISSHITEVIKMKNAVDNMKTGLRSFKKYVSADLVSELIKLKKEAVLGTERKELTIFLSDIANFTTISENLSPEQLSENLGEYFKGMTKIILQNNGTVDNYTGDSIMAFWSAPYYIKDHAVSGCYTALQCRRYLDTLDKRWTEEGIPLFATRMGLNTGDAIVGNIGYEERFAYTAIGDNVNLASRLEGLNKFYGTRIMISEFTYAQAREHIEARLIDVVSVKGKSKSVMVYELISEKNNIGRELKQFIDLFNYGADLYLDRKWSEAIKVFKETCKKNPHDIPSQIFLKRCSKYAKKSPPLDWSGAIVMQKK